MLKNGENYNAELYRKSALPPADREITVEQAIIIARNQGYKIKSELHNLNIFNIQVLKQPPHDGLFVVCLK